MRTATNRNDNPQQLSLVPDDASDEGIIAAALAILEKRVLTEKIERPEDAKRFFILKLAERQTEAFAVLFLNTRHKVIAYEELFHGDHQGSEVHPRVVAQRALAHNASAIMVAHNHPSGDPDPSAADRAVTARLKQALALIDVRMLDHIVVGGGSSVSFAERGYL